MKILSHGYVLLFNLLLIFSITVIINGDDETYYMFQLMKALSPTPLGWSNKTHHCKWKGISCNSTTQAVTSIILPSSSLTGTLPTNIHILTNLTHVDLHNNSLNGPLPDFSELDLLQTISLGHNKFSSVPDNCFQNIFNLRTINLSNNLNLNNWDFPMDDLSYSEYLETLDLEATNMIGKLDPHTFYGFENLQTFFISHNKLHGNPLQSLEQSPIRYLRVNNNRFYGTISFISSMGNLSQAWLHHNMYFSGRIPNMSNCTNLSDLQLQSNRLTGLIPPSLLTLPSLSIISLGDNMLQGRIPVFQKGVKATLEPNFFCRSDGGPCDSQIMTLLEIFEAFNPIPIFTIKGNDACTGGQWTNYSIQFPLSLLISCERIIQIYIPERSN
ncbi:non-specific serine/threonine protein kinase [Trifolium repens]|nr:non-specific serine/threonine protein kinase [Trifolium repens]